MTNDNTINQLINNFLSELTLGKRHSRATIANYRSYLNKFLYWLKQEKIKIAQSSNITAEHLENYHHWLKKQTSPTGHLHSPATQNYYLIALRSFLKNLTKQGFKTPSHHLLKLNRSSPTNVINLNTDEIKSILRAGEQSGEPELIKRRDLAILKLLFTSGLKVSEITKLKQADVKSEQTSLLVANNKGLRRQVPLTNEVKQLLNNYLSIRHDTDPALFISHDRAQSASGRRQHSGHALSPRSLQRIVANLRRRAGLRKKITPSTLRQFFAQSLVKGGMKINEVQKTLGHANKITTKLYLKNLNH